LAGDFFGVAEEIKAETFLGFEFFVGRDGVS
jgi:hypothetical protein